MDRIKSILEYWNGVPPYAESGLTGTRINNPINEFDNLMRQRNVLIDRQPVRQLQMSSRPTHDSLYPEEPIINPNNPIQLKEVTITAEAPTYIKYKQAWEKENPFDVNKYVENRFNNPVGREAIKRIDEKGWREQLKQEGLQKRQQELDEATKMGLLYQRFNPQDKDDMPIADEQFKKRYGTSPHRYRYDNDPEYRNYYEQVARKSTSKIDYPSTDLRRKDAVAPNNMWMYSNLTGESKKAMTDFSNEVIGMALPIPGLEAMGKIPSVFKAGKNLIKPVSKVVNKVDDVGKGFKSEINWAKWNKEIPKDKEIMQEYNAIEKMLNETKSFGINPVTNKPYSVDINVPKEIDIVLRSKNFKNSFPDFNFDTDAIYRGERWARKNYINKDRPTDAVFGTSDFKGSTSYVTHQNTEDIIHPHKIDEVFKEYNIKEDELIYNDGSAGGINVLAIPNKSKTFRVNAKNNKFTMLPNHKKLNQEYVENNTLNLKHYIEKYGKDKLFGKGYNDSKLYASTDNYASALNDGLKDYNRVLVENVYDGTNKPISVHIINPRNTPIKSIFYNNGKFDLTNPNIYKGLIPPVLVAGSLKPKKNKNEKRNNEESN